MTCIRPALHFQCIGVSSCGCSFGASSAGVGGSGGACARHTQHAVRSHARQKRHAAGQSVRAAAVHVDARHRRRPRRRRARVRPASRFGSRRGASRRAGSLFLLPEESCRAGPPDFNHISHDPSGRRRRGIMNVGGIVSTNSIPPIFHICQKYEKLEALRGRRGAELYIHWLFRAFGHWVNSQF